MNSYGSRFTYGNFPKYWSQIISTENQYPIIRFSQRLRAAPFQCVALLLCVALGLAMVMNTQMGGEGMWFWYADLFHQGVKLYSGLHIPLQPDFVLVNDAWMSLVGRKTILTQLPSVFLILALCAGMHMVLRESDWPDWQRAIVLAGAFALTVSGHSYRFDDYHVMSESCILFALVALLRIARAVDVRQQMRWAALLGVLCGIILTTRLTDGAAMIAASCCCVPLLVRRGRLLTLCLLLISALVVALLMVRLTGDSLSVYLSSTIFKAAASKGGTGSILAAPLLLVRNALLRLRTSGKWLLLWLVMLAALAAAAQRYWTRSVRRLVLLQMGVAALAFVLTSRVLRELLLEGTLISPVVLVLLLATYLLAPIVAAHAVWRKMRSQPWDSRECLVLVPLALWASYSAASAGEPLTNYYSPVAILLLLYLVLRPAATQAAWRSASFLTVVALVGLSSVTSKYLLPYSWQTYTYSPMFHHREWYQHPVYGPLYIDSDLLHFSEAICQDIHGGGPQAKLLSLPFPYPNYFCATPPWHGYVQTFFDISTRASIEQMMRELDAAPPQWIVYQRQMHILDGAERLYNHGQPLAQRDLDAMILKKIANGEWRLVDKRNYLEGDGWYVIQTRP